MKKVSWMVVFVCMISVAVSGQKRRLFCRNELCSITQIGSSANSVHLVANEFEREVGDVLKDSRFSATVVDFKPTIWTWRGADRQYFELRYSARIKAVSKEVADHHFTRQGNIGQGRTLEEAKLAAEKGFKEDKKPEALRGASGGKQETCHDDWTGSSDTGFYYIHECFVAWK